MSTPHEQGRALIYCLRLCLDLTDPKLTPKIPLDVRKRARAALRHAPYPHDLARIVSRSQGILELTDEDLEYLLKGYK